MAKAGPGLLVEMAKRLHELGVIPHPNNVEHVVIDLKSGQMPMIYIRCFGDKRLLEVFTGLENVGDFEVKT